MPEQLKFKVWRRGDGRGGGLLTRWGGGPLKLSELKLWSPGLYNCLPRYEKQGLYFGKLNYCDDDYNFRQ